MTQVKKRKTSIFFVLIFTFLCILSISLMILFSWSLMTSMKNFKDWTFNKLWFPVDGSFANFKNAYQYFYVEVLIDKQFRYFYMFDMFVNSLLYAGGCALANTLIPFITAYAVAKYKYRFGKVLYQIVIVTMMIPIVGSLPSSIQMSKALGIFDTFFGLWIMKANFLGMYFLVFYANFKAIPYDYTEAAKIDGASDFCTMTKIICPMAMTTFFTVYLLYFFVYWNDYQTPMVYLRSYPTVAYGMYRFQFSNINEISFVPAKIAGTILMATPIIVVFLVFNKRLMKNISIGGLKG